MPIEIVDFPIENGGSFHSYVSVPEGTAHVLFVLPFDALKKKLQQWLVNLLRLVGSQDRRKEANQMAKEELSRIRNQKVPQRSFSSLHHPFVPNVPNVTAGVCVALKQHESRAFKTHSTSFYPKKNRTRN